MRCRRFGCRWNGSPVRISAHRESGVHPDVPRRSPPQDLTVRSRPRGFVEPLLRKEAPGMQKIKEAASEFLASKRVAVTGVSRQPKDHGSNVVYRRLRERGYEIFAVNPNAGEVEG